MVAISSDADANRPEAGSFNAGAGINSSGAGPSRPAAASTSADAATGSSGANPMKPEAAKTSAGAGKSRSDADPNRPEAAKRILRLKFRRHTMAYLLLQKHGETVPVREGLQRKARLCNEWLYIIRYDIAT